MVTTRHQNTMHPANKAKTLHQRSRAKLSCHNRTQFAREVRLWIELPILFHDSGLFTRSELAIEPFQIILNELSLKKA